jgi:hypothetical protein
MPTQVSFGGYIVACAGFVDGYQSAPDSGDHHCFVMRLKVREVMRWQIDKLYLPAVRSDKKDCVVTHYSILWAAAAGTTGLQKNDAHASTYVQQGYRPRCAPRSASRMFANMGSLRMFHSAVASSGHATYFPGTASPAPPQARPSLRFLSRHHHALAV